MHAKARALTVGLLLSGTAAWAMARDALPAPVREALAAAAVPEEAMGGIAIPLQRWAWTWSHGADRPMQPGSAMKVLTGVVAMDRLGPNLRGRTELLSAARIEGEVLRGDLVLRGGADPELGWPQLWQLLNELREQGVREIAGDIVLDRSLFRPARIDQGLEPFDGAPEFAYNVIPDALMLSGNLMGLEIAADAHAVRARTVPRIDGVELQSAQMLNDARCADWGDTWQPPLVKTDGPGVHIELRGAFPRGCTVRLQLQLFDRERLAALMLQTLWSRLGGSLRGQVREGSAPADARMLAQRVARPWGEVLRQMNKQSDNTLTRLLYLQLGVPDMAAEAQRTTLELAERAVRRWLDEQGIPSTGLVLDNGSGLSRSERITPRQLALVIRQALHGRHASELLMSLPTVGVDGTMRNRLKDSPAAGWARLKTGTLRNVAALAGVVRDAGGHSWILVAMINHAHAQRARPALDALVDWIARGRSLHEVAGPREP
jgi:D-alanyl-D-alanine carboxypeptidase/D-alanyl-D-alanine-endopeptidase (penicillin-binding protein 4)